MADGVDDLDQLFREAKSARRPFEPDMYLNVAFFTGHQWVNWAGGRLNRPAIDPRRSLVTDNRIMPVVTHNTSRKVKNKPVFAVTPFSSDDADVEAANIGNKVLEGDWSYLDLQQKLFDAELWADVACDGFWKIYWDPTIGEKNDFLIGPSGQPLLNPEDQTPLRASEAHLVPPEILDQVKVKSIAPGDACVMVKSPLELYPDPLATSMEDLEYMFDETVHSLNYVRQRYPVDVDGKEFVPVPDADVNPGIAEARLLGGFSFADATAKGVKVREYWCRPNIDHPKGKRCVTINDKLVADEEPPDPMPYVRFSSIEIPGRFWSQGMTTFLRGPQESRNKLLTQIEENAKRIGNPALMKSRQANVEYNGIPGEQILYDSTVSDAVPSYLEPPNIPSYVENQLARIDESMNEISGIHEVSKATVPTGVTAAAAINLLQEQDDTRLGPQIQAMERALEIAGTKLLKLRAQFNTDERTIRLVGEDGDWDIFAFKGAMLGSEPQVEVQAGSAMPRSKAAKQAAMFQLLELAFQYKLPIDQRNLRKFFKDFEVGSLDRLFDSISNDEGQTVREHRLLYNGQALPINSQDDDNFHIDAHTDEQKSARFAGQPPAIQQLFNDHVDLHRQRLKHIVDMQVQAQSQETAPEPPKQSINYKDAPPDIQRQMEEADGYKPSDDGITVDQQMRVEKEAEDAPTERTANA